MFKTKIIMIILSLFFSYSPIAFCGLTDGLVAYYPFSGNANDESGNGNNGSVIGATLTSDRLGRANSAYSFDGATNYILIPAASSLETQDAITLSAWVYHLSNSSPQHVVNMSALDTGYRLAAWWANPAGNSLEFYDLNQSQHIVDDGHQPYIGSWTHVTGTWDGAVMRIYRDGLLAGSTAFAGKISVANNDLHIGVVNPIPWPIQGYFHGYIDEVAVYNRALSQSEINQLMALDDGIDIIPSDKCDQSDLPGTWMTYGVSGDTFDGKMISTNRCKIEVSSSGSIIGGSSYCKYRDRKGVHRLDVVRGNIEVKSNCVVTGYIRLCSSGDCSKLMIEHGTLSMEKNAFSIVGYSKSNPDLVFSFTGQKR